MGRAKAASRDKREREKKSTMRRNLSVWIRPDVLPLVAAVGTGLGLAVFMSVRTLWTHNDVTLSKARPFQYGNTSYERLMPRAKVVQVRTQSEHRQRAPMLVRSVSDRSNRMHLNADRLAQSISSARGTDTSNIMFIRTVERACINECSQ